MTRDPGVSFVGRGWALDAIDEWLAGDEPAMLVTGKPGSGKSALARQVVAISDGMAFDGGRAHLRRGALLYAHFCRARDASVLDPVRFVERLSERLATRHAGYRERMLNSGDGTIRIHGEATVGVAAAGAEVTGVKVSVHVGDPSPALAFDRLVRTPLDELVLESGVVVLVDALDEALSLDAGETIAGILGDLLDVGTCPHGLRLLLTSRPDRRVTAPLAGARTLDLVRDAPPGADDLRTYAERRLGDAALAGDIATASDGVFLYARYAIDEITRRGAPRAMPSGLDGHYRRFIERELARTAERWHERFRPVLGLLAVARGDGLPRPLFAAVTGLPRSAVDDALRALEQFLEPASADAPPRLYHESFREFLREDADYCVYPEEATDALVRWFREQVEGGADWPSFPYALANLATHAADIGALDSLIWLRSFLVHAEPYGMRAALRRTGSAVATLYAAAFHHLVERSPLERALALRIVCERLGDRALADRLAELPTGDVRPSWAATDVEAGAVWYRPSLAVLDAAAAEIDGELTVALAADREHGIRLWWPERAVKVVDFERTWDTRLAFLCGPGYDLLVISGHKTAVADAHTGRITHRAWSPGPSSVVVHAGEPWLVEAHPVVGPVWLRSMRRGDLWAQRGGSLRPTEQQAAAATIARLETRAQRLLTVVPDPWMVAIVGHDGELLVADGSGATKVPRVCVDVLGTTPLAAAVAPDGPLLAVLTEEGGLCIVDARARRAVARLDPERVVVSLAHSDRPEQVQLLTAERPVAYAATGGGDVVRWDLSTGRVDRGAMRAHSRLRVGVHRDEPIVVGGGEDGLRIWREPEFFAQRPPERGPACLVAAARVGDDAVTAWVTDGSRRGRMWAVDADTGESRAVRQVNTRSPEALMIGAVEDEAVVVVLPDTYRDVAKAYWLDDQERDIAFELGSGWPDALAGFRCDGCATRQDDANHLRVAELVAAATGTEPVDDVRILAADPQLQVALRLAPAGGFHVHDLRTGRQAALRQLELAAMDDYGTSAVTLLDGAAVAIATIRNLATGIRSVWTAREGEQWRRLTETRSYVGFLAAAGPLVAFGNEFEVRVLSLDGGEPGIVVPQPATALAFDHAGGLVLGTARGVIRLELD